MLVGLGQQTHLFGVQTQVLALVIDELNTFEQRLIEDDTVTQVTQHRTHLLGDLVHLVVTVCFQHVEEYTYHAVQEQTGTIECHNRVLKSRFRFVIHDRFYLCLVLTDSLFESRHVVR